MLSDTRIPTPPAMLRRPDITPAFYLDIDPADEHPIGVGLTPTLAREISDTIHRLSRLTSDDQEILGISPSSALLALGRHLNRHLKAGTPT